MIVTLCPSLARSNAVVRPETPALWQVSWKALIPRGGRLAQVQ